MSRPLKCHVPIEFILEKLTEAGLKPYLHSVKGASKYIKFSVSIGGSLRIADHPQRARYSYRWNLRSDKRGVYKKEKNGSVCMYYNIFAFHDMIEDMKVARDVIRKRRYQSSKNVIKTKSTKEDLKLKGNALIKKSNNHREDYYDMVENYTYMGGHF